MTNREIIHIGDKAYEKCKIIVLPTEKGSIVTYHNGQEMYFYAKPIKKDSVTQAYHLYILSNGEIKEPVGWCLMVHPDGSVAHNTPLIINDIVVKAYKQHQGYKRIIATTDSSLTIEVHESKYEVHHFKRLPRPSNAFVQNYVELQGKIDEVLVELWGHLDYGKHSIDAIFGQPKVAPDNTITIKPVSKELSLDELVKDHLMQTIVVQWIAVDSKKEGWGYSEEMRVVSSNHPRFAVGSRFDFGFFSVATKEGYTIISLPIVK